MLFLDVTLASRDNTVQYLAGTAAFSLSLRARSHSTLLLRRQFTRVFPSLFASSYTYAYTYLTVCLKSLSFCALPACRILGDSRRCMGAQRHR
jgi:hypothetical protein